MDLPTLFFLYRGVGSHDSGRGIRVFVHAGGTLLFDGARVLAEDAFAIPPELEVCRTSETVGVLPGDWSSSSTRMATYPCKLLWPCFGMLRRTLPTSNATQRSDSIYGEGKDGTSTMPPTVTGHYFI
jgi:hypothetical protein